MRFIRHVLSHLMLIFLITGIATTFYFRNQLLSDEHVQKIDMFAGKIHPGLVRLVSPLPVVIKNAESPAEKKQELVQIKEKALFVDKANDVETEITENNSPEVNEKLVAELVREYVREEIIAIEKIKSTGAAEKDDDKAEAIKTLEVKVDEVKANKPEPEIVQIDVTEQKPVIVAESSSVENAVKEVLVISDDKEAASYNKLLSAARSAYSKGDVELSIKKYNELIELENHEADVYGELGNVYYAQGKWNSAGDSYYEAAMRLINKGQLSQVGYLHKVIQGLDVSRAEKLAEQMRTKR